MMHPAQERWRRYAADEMDDAERLELDDHLAGCEACLLTYMEAAGGIAEWDAERADRLTEAVMTAVAGRTHGGTRLDTDWASGIGAGPGWSHKEDAEAADRAQNEEAGRGRGRRIAWDARRKRTLLHYAIAVCIMLLMMSTGVFDRLAAQPEQWKAGRQQEQGGSLSDTLMAKTSMVLDKVLDGERP
ncbi:zf-HC2 domain-containing protein [Paenibacillus aurantiacus]|uniref:Zf-HC2 domain-containing protein n=1 Tax=Paenibacillus aurantiacus TaxID=1936118 RepID=A0ABV5KR18_9BACL